MSPVNRFTLGKEERICSGTLIERLFNGGDSKSLSSYPLRVVYLVTDREEGDIPAKMMISVSKRHFKRAVKRNKVKRQVREAYRLNKHLVTDKMSERENQQLNLAFIWLSDDIFDTKDVVFHVQRLLERINEKL